MMIEEISLRHFRRFREASFNLREGLNVVKGPNESGKSTLLQAVLAALFWRADSTRLEVRESVTWGTTGGMRVELRGRADGRSFHLVKDFSAKRAELTWDGESESDPRHIQDRLREWLGVGSETAFRATAGIRQDEVASISEGGKEIGESLQSAVGGLESGPGAGRAREEIEKELAELLRGTRVAAKNPGPLARVEGEISILRRRREELSRAVEEREEARRRLAGLGGEAERARQRLEVLESLVRDTQEYMDIKEDVEDFRRRYQVLEISLKLLEEDESLAREEETRYGSLRKVLEEESEELGELERKRAAAEERRRALAHRLEEAAALHPRGWAPWVLAAGLTLVLAGLAGIALSPYLLALCLVGLGLVAVSLFPGGYLSFMAGGRRLRELQALVEEARAAETETAKAMERVVAGAGCSSLEGFQSLRKGYLELLARRKEIADRLEMLSIRGGDREKLEEEARRLAAEAGMRSRRLKDLKGRALDPEGLQRALREREELRRKLEDIRAEEVRCEVILAEGGHEEELLQVEEELAQLEEERRRLIRREKALRLALEWLERASSESMGSITSRLEEMTGRYLSRITGGRYSRVFMDGETLSVAVWSPEKGGEVGPESLSRGTVDQVYLAARLSLVDIICGDRRPPLLLDDPFVTFDPQRLERAMELLREYARGRQVIIFTCGDHYDAYADHMVNLSQDIIFS